MLGPKKHYKKNGTPRMGGVVFIVSISLTYLFFLFINNSLSIKYLILLFPFLFYGIIGFVDDYIKVMKQNNNSPKSTPIEISILWALQNGFFDDIDVKRIGEAVCGFEDFFKNLG